MSEQSIFIKGARVNNLKNIDIEIPRNRFIVITGLSGSGKSSLAFDTLYAEGQRRYVESLSAYARQFLGRMSKPECDYIKGIPPAIAIEQKVNTRNPRSTVGTSTEIYDYLRLLYARIGKTYSPISGELVKKHQVDDVVNCALGFPDGTRFALLTNLILPEGRDLKTQLQIWQKEGFPRVEVEGRFVAIEDLLAGDTLPDASKVRLVIDRLSVSHENDTVSRLADSVETAFFEGGGECVVQMHTAEGVKEFHFSKRFEADGITFNEPSDLMFNFNNPVGACPECEGFGRVIGIDEDLVVPNKTLSVYDDAVMCWRGEKMSEWKNDLIRRADSLHFPIHRPYYKLTDREKDILWHGSGDFEGIDGFFAMLEANQYKIQYRVMLARYRGKTICPVCKGSRLKPEAEYVKVGGRSITELVNLPVGELKAFFDNLQLDEHDTAIAKRLLTEIKNRIRFLQEVGLDYLTLNRLSSTLSGGESQRINLATSLGSSLVGSLYILDEPSIGLHSRDTHLLIKVLRELQELGNTVVVVEHDEEIIRAADYIIDIGPLAGRLGGEVVYQGDLSRLPKATRSYTMRYLTGECKIEVPAVRRKWNQYIEVEGAAQNNLKSVNVRFPLHVMTVVTGVSGSGKSSLVRDVFYRGLLRYYGEGGEMPGTYSRFTGDMDLIKADEFVSEGGRCEECKGEGTITVEMQFMADIVLECEACHGKRYKQDVLEIEYRGKNISDVLDMTINQAIEFFSEVDGSQEKRIVKRLKPLQDVGLGYIKLGQSSSTLSGGENQRVKLAFFLSNERQEPTLFIFDEPTTGLHFHDINTLLKSFNQLIERGHTVVIIEHNMDVIKCADHIIDLGPEGGKAGGYVVCTGTPEEVARCEASYTGRFLKEKLAL